MLETVKRPEYTGANRCSPCTAANVVLLIGLCASVTIVSPVGAAVLAVLGSVTIWLRGYFVPFTPRFGPWLKQVVADHVNRPPRAPDHKSLARGDVSGERVVEELLRTDVLTTTDGDELGLTPAFEADWHALIHHVREKPLTEFERWAGTVFEEAGVAAVEAVKAVEPAWSDPYVVVSFEAGEEVVLTYPVALAELSAVAALDGTNLEAQVRLHAAGPLRGFLDACPVCDTSLHTSRYSGCCGNPRADEERLGLVCTSCKSVLYKYPD